MTLVEVLVTGMLFAVVLTMIAQAMVTGHRTQSLLSNKINVHRKASTALDMLVRDAAAARLTGMVTHVTGGSTNVMPTSTILVMNQPDELQITRLEGGTTIYDAPSVIRVGYFRNAADETLRRALYDAGGSPLAGTPANGKIIARDVKLFDVNLVPNATAPGLFTLRARIQVSTINDPIVKEISLEAP